MKEFIFDISFKLLSMLFHNKGPLNEMQFWPMLVVLSGVFSFRKECLVLILGIGARLMKVKCREGKTNEGKMHRR